MYKKKENKCVFRFILDFRVSADLEWWIYVGFFAHLPDEDCVVKYGLCFGVCNFTPTPTPLYPCRPN